MPPKRGPRQIYDPKYADGPGLVEHKCPYDCYNKVKAVHTRVAQLEAQVRVLCSLVDEILELEENTSTPLTKKLTPVPRAQFNKIPPMRVEPKEVVLSDDDDYKPATRKVRKTVEKAPKRKRARTESQTSVPALEEEGTSALDLMGCDEEEEGGGFQDDEAPNLELAVGMDIGTVVSMDDEEDFEDLGDEPPVMELEAEEPADEVQKALDEAQWLTLGDPISRDGLYYTKTIPKKVLLDDDLNLLVERYLLMEQKDLNLTQILAKADTKPWLTTDRVRNSLERLSEEGLLNEPSPMQYKKATQLDHREEKELFLAQRGILLEEYEKRLKKA